MIWVAWIASALVRPPVATYRVPPKTIKAVRARNPPIIDGKIDDDQEWISAAKFEGMIDTFRGEAAPERAEFWMEYDDKFLYFAARLHDRSPKAIQAGEYRTNVSLDGEDSVELLISPSGNLTDFDLIQMNPHGATNIEPAGGRALKREWLGEIVSKGRITSMGWEVESRIPWRLFKLPSAGQHDMRFNVRRRVPRDSRVYAFANTVAGHRSETPVWQGVEVPRVETDRSVKALAYGYLGNDSDSRLVANGGLDLKANITGKVTMVGSVNPDFRNVENPILSLDFSRFARLAGDNRPFFQEGSGYISSRIFVSQVIPTFDVGVSAYGNLAPKTRFGLLNAVTFGREEDLVASLVSSPDPQNIFAGTVTHVSKPGFQNEASLLRWNHVSGSYRFAAIDSQTVDGNLGHGASDTFQCNYFGNGFVSTARLDRVTPNYVPGLGFQPEVDYEGGMLHGSYDKDYKVGPILTEGIFATGQSYRRLDGQFYRDSIVSGADVLLRNQLLFSGSFFADRFESQKDHTVSLDAQYPANDMRRQVSFDATTGMQEELLYNSYSLNGTYSFGRRLSTSLGVQIVRLGTSYQQQAIGSWNCDLGHDRYIGGRLLQTTNGTNAYVSFQQSGNRGVEYFFIVGDPNAVPIDNRRLLINFRPSVILKVIVPFQIGSSRGG